MLPIRPWRRCIHGHSFNCRNNKKTRKISLQHHTRSLLRMSVSTCPLNSLASNTRSSICCTSGGRLPISSRNNVTPAASSQKLCFLLSAPMNDPFSCPNRADAASSFDSSPQSTTMNGFPARLLLACIFSAISLAPLPDFLYLCKQNNQ